MFRLRWRESPRAGTAAPTLPVLGAHRRLQTPLTRETHPPQPVLSCCSPTCLGEQATKAGARPPCWPHGSHRQPCSRPSCEWKSTQGGGWAESPSGSGLLRHRIHAASQELFFHAWLPGEPLKGRLVWPCLLSGCRLQPTALPPHTTPSKHPQHGSRARGMQCRAPSCPHSLQLTQRGAPCPSVRCCPAASSRPRGPAPQ